MMITVTLLVEARVADAVAKLEVERCLAALAQAEAHQTQTAAALKKAEADFTQAVKHVDVQDAASPAPAHPPPRASSDPDASLPERIRAALAAEPTRPLKVIEIIEKLGITSSDETAAKSVRAAITRMKTQHNGGIAAVGHGRYRLK